MKLADLQRVLAPVKRRLWNLVARGVVRRVDEAGARQELQLELLTGETRDRVERFQQFGFYAHPPEGAEAVVLFVAGDRAHGIAVAVEHRDERPQDLEAGEVCVRAKGGAEVRVKPDGTILVRAGSTVTIQAPTVAVEGDVTATGNVSDRAGSLADLRAAYDVHTHAETGSTTLPPEPQVPQ